MPISNYNPFAFGFCPLKPTIGGVKYDSMRKQQGRKFFKHKVVKDVLLVFCVNQEVGSKEATSQRCNCNKNLSFCSVVRAT